MDMRLPFVNGVYKFKGVYISYITWSIDQQEMQSWTMIETIRIIMI
jgi:hypothetical protein